MNKRIEKKNNNNNNDNSQFSKCQKIDKGVFKFVDKT